MELKNEVEINQNVYVLVNQMEQIYETYQSRDIPAVIKKEIKKLYDMLLEEYTKDYGHKNWDIEDIKLIEQITFNNDTYLKNKHKES